MRTILIPVDATPASENAVDTAIEWAGQYGYHHIILLKTTYETMFRYINISEGYALTNEENINRNQEEDQSLFERLRRKIEQASSLKVTIVLSELPLLRCTIERIKRDSSVELLILGSDHRVVANDSFVSANLIGITRASPIKVLVVPNSYEYTVSRNILIPCEIGNISGLNRLSRFAPGLKRDSARLMLLNVNTKENVAVAEHKKKEWENLIGQYITDIPFEIHYSFDRKIIEGVLSFTSSHQVDLIIALPGRHSFLYYLANKSISEGIFQNANQAVLILK